MNAFKKHLKEKKISIDTICMEKAEMFEGLFKGYSYKTNLLKKKYYLMDGIGYIFLKFFLLIKWDLMDTQKEEAFYLHLKGVRECL